MAEGGEGLPPAYVHAFETLGFLVTEENAHLFGDEDLAAWKAAVEEGERLHGPTGHG